jgi:hypothetical protein
MPAAGGRLEQGYNAQAAVAAGSLLVVATDVVETPNDKNQVEPMLETIGALRNQARSGVHCRRKAKIPSDNQSQNSVRQAASKPIWRVTSKCRGTFVLLTGD